MFIVYIDDSGTAPDQKVVIAAAMIVPAANVASLNRDWADFDRTFEFKGDFHCSECVARNSHTVFADWNDKKVRSAFSRARSIMKEHASKAISFTINKDDFAAEAPEEWLKVGGHSPFTWTFRILLSLLRMWNNNQQKVMPFEYVIDWVQPRDREEIEMVMAQCESAYPGEYRGKFTFGKRQLIPGLQCCDLLAWSAFSHSRYFYQGTPMRELADASFRDLRSHGNGEWWDGLGHTRESLREAIRLDHSDTAGELSRSVWYARYLLDKLKEKVHTAKTSKRFRSK